MPIEITISKTVRLSDIWCNDKSEWEDHYKDNLEAIIELLNEDAWEVLFEESGGFEGLIQSARWVE